MAIELEFEPNFQKRVLAMRFSSPTSISTRKDVLQWRQRWTEALKSWHSPYSALIDATNLTIQPENMDVMRAELSVMQRFFAGLFLKKAVVFGIDEARGSTLLPFEVFGDQQSAALAVGLKEGASRIGASDFRSVLNFQNDFQRHVIELGFSEPVRIDTNEQIAILKSKLSNILMQWHSKWSLLVDCTNLTVAAEIDGEWHKFDKYFRGFFMKTVIGYSPAQNGGDYPFPVYRARHKAVAQLENEGAFMGNEADCKSRKPPT
jgi:hypothetical protein